jgi:crotonobetainyl-CoA:carnitine CoA-transferase CaiB-like acyl-CoA transferase
METEINYGWENCNRDKKSLTLDVSLKKGQSILYKLIEKADVFLTNMRPFELEKHNLGYTILRQVNQRLIYGSLNGYGKKGSDRDVPGFDAGAYWARAGIAHRLAPKGLPARSSAAFGDNISGLHLAFGIMMALFFRERTGIGQEVDVSSFQTGVFQISNDIAGTLLTGQDLQHTERGAIANALTNYYQTKDNRWLILAALQPDIYWSKLCRAIEREDLEHDPRFETFEPRIENHVPLFNILVEAFMSRTLAEWKIRLTEASFPWGPVQTLPEVIIDPQARANGFFVPFEHPNYGRIELVANPVNLSETPATIRTLAPEFGQHTEETLLECGYSWADIGEFKKERVIR